MNARCERKKMHNNIAVFMASRKHRKVLDIRIRINTDSKGFDCPFVNLYARIPFLRYTVWKVPLNFELSSGFF